MSGFTLIDNDDLGTLVWCAMQFGHRLPHGVVPEEIWNLLTPEWRDRITKWIEEDEAQRTERT